MQTDGRKLLDKPKSLIFFLCGILAGLLVFVPLIVAALALEKPMMLLVGAAGLAVTWLPAAFMGFLFTAALAAGRYKEIRSLPWHEQVW